MLYAGFGSQSQASRLSPARRTRRSTNQAPKMRAIHNGLASWGAGLRGGPSNGWAAMPVLLEATPAGRSVGLRDVNSDQGDDIHVSVFTSGRSHA
jgi:hypothetical protein